MRHHSDGQQHPSHCKGQDKPLPSHGDDLVIHGTSWDIMGPYGTHGLTPPSSGNRGDTHDALCFGGCGTFGDSMATNSNGCWFNIIYQYVQGCQKMGMGQTFGGWTSGIHMYSPRALTHSHILVYWVVIPVTSRYSILDLHRLYHQLSFWLKINPHNRIVFS